VEQEKGPLASTEINLSSKYKLESETSTSSALSLLLLPTLPLLSSSILPTSSHNMSQHNANLEQII